MSSRLIAGIVAGICGTFFLGYCVYFDRKRRSDPMFKQKLLERRRREREAQKEASMEEMKNRVPDRKDAAAVQQFFLEEVQLGEDLLAQDKEPEFSTSRYSMRHSQVDYRLQKTRASEFEQAVKHLTNAVVVCGQPQQLLQVFHSTLPEHVFQMLVESLNSIQSTTMQKTEDGDSLD